MVKKATRPGIFKWRQTAPELILCAVRWYLRYSLSLRDVEELLTERALKADHTTILRWVQRYGPELEQRMRRHLKPTNKSWRVDETYVRVQGRWCYLYRAIDSAGATIDFLLSALRDAEAAATPIAHQGVIAGAKVQAMTMLDILTRPELVTQAWDYFRNVQTKDTKYQSFLQPGDQPAIWLNQKIMEEYRPKMKPLYYDPAKFNTYLEQLGISYPALK